MWISLLMNDVVVLLINVLLHKLKKFTHMFSIYWVVPRLFPIRFLRSISR